MSCQVCGSQEHDADVLVLRAREPDEELLQLCPAWLKEQRLQALEMMFKEGEP